MEMRQQRNLQHHSSNVTYNNCDNTESLLNFMGWLVSLLDVNYAGEPILALPSPEKDLTVVTKIFKGVRVAIREHPYVVSIRRQFSHYVTGTLLTTSLIVTVAHPLYLVPIQELGVVLGENYADRGTMIHTVILIVIHKEFDPYNLHNDIAMIKMYEESNIRTSVKTIQLLAGVNLNRAEAFVTGWGRCDMTGRELCLPRGSIYYPGEMLDPMLRTIMFNITLPNLYCDGYTRHDIVLHPGMLCVGDAREENPVAPCLAVPGAPLVVRGRLVGIQSWGLGCGYALDLPLVYTSIQYYDQWIWQNMEILNSLPRTNYTELFDATRASIKYEWLLETRLIKPSLNDDFLWEFQPAPIDSVLTNLQGNYYDIRDFVDNGRYHNSKFEMLKDIWQINEKLTAINKTRDKLLPGVPLFSNYTLVDDYDNDEYM